jgi:hypothetical protein
LQKLSAYLNDRWRVASVLEVESYIMKLRYLLPTLLLSALPLTTHADFEFSVDVVPPVLPVYEQPPCPVEGYLYTPGYWAYGDADYYWVPGVWVAPPTPGVLWTPGYWSFSGGSYGFNAGYWGPTVGFYGGVNYGFGYGGSGFYGGRWDGGAFRYNTAVTNVNTTIIHNTYEDRTVINNAATGSRASFNGPNGVTAKPTAAEEAAAKEHHIPATPAQVKTRQQASSNPALRAKNNNGNPAATLAKTAGAKPEAKKPEAAEPKPEAKKSEAAEPKPEAKKSEAAEPKPEAKKSETAEPKPEAKKSEAAEPKPEAKKPETAEAKPKAKKSETAEAKPKAAAKPAERPAKEEENAAGQKHAAEPAKTKSAPDARAGEEAKKKNEPQ